MSFGIYQVLYSLLKHMYKGEISKLDYPMRKMVSNVFSSKGELLAAQSKEPKARAHFVKRIEGYFSVLKAGVTSADLALERVCSSSSSGRYPTVVSAHATTFSNFIYILPRFAKTQCVHERYGGCDH